jgi:toxin ParE1/3/4
MAGYRLSRFAERDIEILLEWSQERFGEKARIHYEALLARAITDVAADPERAGSRERPELAPGARTYHLRHSRDTVPKRVGRVKRPRHFLLYRVVQDGQIEIGRVLHDGMDLDRHLPEEYRPT